MDSGLWSERISFFYRRCCPNPAVLHLLVHSTCLTLFKSMVLGMVSGKVFAAFRAVILGEAAGMILPSVWVANK